MKNFRGHSFKEIATNTVDTVCIRCKEEYPEVDSKYLGRRALEFKEEQDGSVCAGCLTEIEAEKGFNAVMEDGDEYERHTNTH